MGVCQLGEMLFWRIVNAYCDGPQSWLLHLFLPYNSLLNCSLEISHFKERNRHAYCPQLHMHIHAQLKHVCVEVSIHAFFPFKVQLNYHKVHTFFVYVDRLWPYVCIPQTSVKIENTGLRMWLWSKWSGVHVRFLVITPHLPIHHHHTHRYVIGKAFLSPPRSFCISLFNKFHPLSLPPQNDYCSSIFPWCTSFVHSRTLYEWIHIVCSILFMLLLSKMFLRLVPFGCIDVLLPFVFVCFLSSCHTWLYSVCFFLQLSNIS